MNTLRERVFKAVEASNNGDPINDVLYKYDCLDALLWLRKFLIQHPEEVDSPLEQERQGDDDEYDS